MKTLAVSCVVGICSVATAAEVTYPPRLPGGKTVVSHKSKKFLRPPSTLRKGVAIAKTAPTVDFLFYPGQTYPGKPWSCWGNGVVVGNKYYSAICDHYAVSQGRKYTGDAFVYEYDSETKKLRKLVGLREILNPKPGVYTPGKIHTRLGMDDDGWIYFATHRGSPRATRDQYKYEGDYLLRHNVRTGKSEVLAKFPVKRHAFPTGRFDAKRMIYYAGSAPGLNSKNTEISFLAWDVRKNRQLAFFKGGPYRDMIITKAGLVYFNPAHEPGPLQRFDPEKKTLVRTKIQGLGLRSATRETPQGIVYTVSRGRRIRTPSTIFAFDVKTETVKEIGPAAVASQQYIGCLEADSSGRYLYYAPGAHGSSETDGTAIVQFDLKTKKKKVIAFLHPFFKEKYGIELRGTYSTMLSPEGDKLYITWNAARDGFRPWDCCAMTVIHIPESERPVDKKKKSATSEVSFPAKEDKAKQETVFQFEDVTGKTGIKAVLEKHPKHRDWRYGHAAGWGDVNGDGKPDLFIGAFAFRKYYTGDDAPVPNYLFLNEGGSFRVQPQKSLEARHRNARAAGCVFADLDNDGDLDLVVTNHVMRRVKVGTRLYENRKGVFEDVTPETTDWPSRIGARNVVALDANRDGLLDLVISDGSYGRTAVANAKLILLENQGKFRFRDATAKYGLPDKAAGGQGIAVGDVNDDGRLDLFVCGSNRMFVTGKDGRFREATPGRFVMPTAEKSEGLHCGAAFGDLDNDGDLDLVTTEHGQPARIHIFQNRGIKNGIPDFKEVTDKNNEGKLFPPGTRQAPIKSGHVGLCDMDNDGKLDIVLTVMWQSKSGPQPVVLRNLTTRNRLKFSRPPFEKMVTYYAPGPIADFDRDGRLDMFLPSWFEAVPNRLMQNTTKAGNWLDVTVTHGKRAAIGATVRIYAAGHAGEKQHLLGRQDIVVGSGYASCEEARAHFGLGNRRNFDIQVTWRGRTVTTTGTAANGAVNINLTK